MEVRKVDVDGYEATVSVEQAKDANGQPIRASWVSKTIITKIGTPDVLKYDEPLQGMNGTLKTVQEAASYAENIARRHIAALKVAEEKGRRG